MRTISHSGGFWAVKSEGAGTQLLYLCPFFPHHPLSRSNRMLPWVRILCASGCLLLKMRTSGFQCIRELADIAQGLGSLNRKVQKEWKRLPFFFLKLLLGSQNPQPWGCLMLKSVSGLHVVRASLTCSWCSPGYVFH